MPLNKAEKAFFIHVVNTALSAGSVTEVPGDVSPSAVFKYFCVHGLAPMFYLAFKETAELLPDDLFDSARKRYKRASAKEVNQAIEFEEVTAALERGAVPHVLLKGIFLKPLYPSPELREMADLDLLINTDDADKIHSILSPMGYERQHYRLKDISYLKQPYIHLELHKFLVESHVQGADYFATAWQKAVLLNGKSYTYQMNNDEYYIYMVHHTMKHFLNGGVTVRNVLDLHLYCNKYSQLLDFDYINSVFSSMGILAFSQNLRALGDAWFASAQATSGLAAFGDFIFENYIENEGEKQITAEIIRPKSKLKKLLLLLFPKRYVMVNLYPSLDNKSFLIPLFWLVRLVSILFNKQHRRQALQKSRTAPDEKLQERREALLSFGIEI